MQTSNPRADSAAFLFWRDMFEREMDRHKQKMVLARETTDTLRTLILIQHFFRLKDCVLLESEQRRSRLLTVPEIAIQEVSIEVSRRDPR